MGPSDSSQALWSDLLLTSEEEMSYLREALVAWLEWTLTAVFGLLVGFRLAWAWVKGDLRESGVRDVPSSCLHDPALGRHKFIKLQSLKLHYVEAGNPVNPLVVMIHGAPDFWFTWRRQIPALSHDYWVVAVDLRGCGDSDGPSLRTKYTTRHLAEDIAHLIRALGTSVFLSRGIDLRRREGEREGRKVGALLLRFPFHLMPPPPQQLTNSSSSRGASTIILNNSSTTTSSSTSSNRYLFFVRLPVLTTSSSTSSNRYLFFVRLPVLTTSSSSSTSSSNRYLFFVRLPVLTTSSSTSSNRYLFFVRLPVLTTSSSSSTSSSNRYLFFVRLPVLTTSSTSSNRYLFFVRLPVLPEVVAQLDDVCMVDSLLAPLVKNKAITDEEVEAYKFNFSRREDWTGPLHHLRQLDLRGVRETEPLPDVVTKPTLLLMGDADPLLPLDTAYRSAEYVERVTIKPLPGLGYLAHVSRAPQVNQVIGEFLRELPWRPLSPLKSTTSAPSSLVGRVMGASLAAVSSTVNKTTEALEMTRSLPGGFMTAAQASLKVAESKLGLDNFY
ncbi:uncharacterized protein [Panulirus ornatus]|uniref:uncharacterized protein n=1 Tax=Panulirus ornatus TaxID=150431 RepID=UPI003A896096